MNYILYKYRPLSTFSGNRKRFNQFTKRIFTHQELWYSAPRNFNDPFDCNLQLHTRDTDESEWLRYFLRLRQFNTANQKTIDKFVRTKAWKTTDFSAHINRSRKIHYEDSSVLCLSRKNNSIPMFSYYADNHKGIAIEFRFSDTNVPCGINPPYQDKGIVFKDVKYDEIPDLNYIRNCDNPKLVDSLLFTKHHEWAHEKEFRIFRRNVKQGNVTFPHNFLSAIILGCRTDSKDLIKVKSWLKDWPSPVDIRKARPSDEQFELFIDHLETLKP